MTELDPIDVARRWDAKGTSRFVQCEAKAIDLDCFKHAKRFTTLLLVIFFVDRRRPLLQLLVESLKLMAISGLQACE